MGNIVLLDENTINQIAAGEVIERPSAVVKELVENSIDAKATNITIEIINGGIKLIRITDNGTGIREDDAVIAFERHATSKIRYATDLIHVMSMGFRGEALASIASVAKVTLLTHNIEESIGTKVVAQGGKIFENTHVGHPIGTSICVEDLFYNTPARYKFLKKDSTEAGYIEDSVVRLALANPNIAFKYINNNKVVIQTNGNGDIKTVIYNIFGKEIASNLVMLDSVYDDIQISGVIGNNQIARSNRNNQIIYINSRYIKDKILSSAVDEAYRTIIPQGKFAFCVLNIQMNPETVDINVHPAKLEARFEDSQKMFRSVYHSVKNAVISDSNNTPFVSNVDNSAASTENIDSYSNNLNLKRQELIKRDINKVNVFEYEISSDTSTIVINTDKNDIGEETKIYESAKINLSNIEPEVYSIKEQVNININNEEPEDKWVNNNEIDSDNLDSKNKKVNNKLEYKYIGAAWNTYIIIQIDDDMYLIDQHAAHERVMYEMLLEKASNNQVESQMMLMPMIIDLTNKEKNIVNENKERFEQVGYIIDDFGENSIKISAVPNLDMDIDYKSMFNDIIDEIDGVQRTQRIIDRERFIYTVACKAAVKANMHLNHEEIISLLDSMMSLNSPFTCPHGRPTAIKMSKYELERKFLRK